MRRAILAAALAFVATASAQDAAPCNGPAYDLALRFTGAWEEYAVTERGEELGGRLDSSLEAGGCAIKQVFTGGDPAVQRRLRVTLRRPGPVAFPARAA